MAKTGPVAETGTPPLLWTQRLALPCRGTLMIDLKLINDRFEPFRAISINGRSVLLRTDVVKDFWSEKASEEVGQKSSYIYSYMPVLPAAWESKTVSGRSNFWLTVTKTSSRWKFPRWWSVWAVGPSLSEHTPKTHFPQGKFDFYHTIPMRKWVFQEPSSLHVSNALWDRKTVVCD